LEGDFEAGSEADVVEDRLLSQLEGDFETDFEQVLVQEPRFGSYDDSPV
jgi:hypothetical protein